MQAHTYVEALAARGVILWREGDSLKLRAPAGVLTPAVLARLKQAKPKILPVLPSEAPQVEVLPSPLVAGEAPKLKPGDLFPAGDCRQEVIAWALSEAKKKTLPELVEQPLTLPSGQVVQPGHASDWLLTRYEVALRLALVPTGDAPAALLILRRDLYALAVAAAEGWHSLYEYPPCDSAGSLGVAVERDFVSSCVSTRTCEHESGFS